MADTPIWSGPTAGITGAYQTKHYAAGLAGGIATTVFDAMATPPEPLDEEEG